MGAEVAIQGGLQKSKGKSLFAWVQLHGELIAAVISGILIFSAWLLDVKEFATASVIVYLLSFLIGGFAKAKEGIEDTIQHRQLNVEMLMIFAAIGSAIIGYWAEGAVLIFIFALSGALETYTMNKSRKEIASLMEIQPEEAWLVREGEEERVHVSELVPGDLILVKPGERITADGKIVKGSSTIDEAAITGESIPVSKGKQEEVFAGTVNLNGSITVTLTKPIHETLFQKIIDLVQSAQSEKSPSQLFIERFEGRYVKIVLTVVFIMLFLPHFIFGWSWNETFYRAMILLVVASPCALVASIMPATLSAISNGARRGILVKGGNHLEQLSEVRAIAFDKTGTLTTGKPEVTEVAVSEDYSAAEILSTVAAIERHSNHPLAKAIVKYAAQQGHEQRRDLENMEIEDVAGWGIIAKLDDQEWKIGKQEFVHKDQAKQFKDGKAEMWASQGKTVVFVQKDEKVVGMLALKDLVRKETKAAVERLKKLGLYTVMLTGDHQKTARASTAESGVQDYIAGCLPENKVAHIKHLKETYGTVAMVGDGINDAPALATANIGISVGEGTDVALETADLVLMKNDLSRISEAVVLSKRMNRIIKQNIIFSISVIILLILTNFFQVLDLPFGVIGHEGSTILVILNSLRLLK
ncbi:cadmium-translocating P-type ATPase [Lederbergia sp. NSJ-179]|uniref:heavy metal translocating P-type ATPase n=1 Tax=Lederbergia sp. NSJ-179 TaxID=2931402 RepID=UPI001FD051C3|nr:heavy metal translocating P-type ATPase [Lederbergia sp. NSJ-179]MCJ7840067.1 cadmium-translocating P-type ATPase [Lederbergia sp. NSJ-179]